MADKNTIKELQLNSPRYRERLREATIRQIEHATDEETVEERRDLLGAIDDAERAAFNRVGNDRWSSSKEII